MHRQVNRARRTLYYKHFIPYGLLVLVIMVLVCVSMTAKGIRDVRENVDAQMASTLEVASNFFESQLTDLERIAYEITINRQLKPYELLLDSYAASRASGLLSPFIHASAYLEDIFLMYSADIFDLYGSDPVIYSKNGPTNDETLWNHIYAFADMRLEALQASLREIGKPRVFFPVHADRPDQGKDYLVYAVPISVDPDGVNRRGVVVFLLDTQAMSDFFDRLFGLYGGSLRVVDATGAILYQVSFADGEPLSFLLSENHATNAVYFAEAEGAVDRAVLHTQPRGLRYVMDWHSSPYAYLRVDVLMIQVPIYMLLLLVGLCCALLLSRIHFKPLSQLYDAMITYGKPPHVSFQGIVTSLQVMEQQWDRLNYQMETQRVFFRMQLLRLVLSGEYQSPQQIEALLAENDLAFDAAQYAVCALRIEDRHPTPPSPGLSAVEHYVEQAYRLPDERRYCVAMESGGHFAVIFCLPRGVQLRAHMRRFFDAVAGELEENLLYATIGGVGLPAYSVADIHTAYDQAVQCFQAAFYKGLGNLYFFEEFPGQFVGDIVWYPTEQEEALINALERGDEGLAWEAIQSLGTILTTLQPPVYVAQSICAGMLNRVAVFARGAQLAPDEARLARLQRISANGYDTLQSYEDELLQLCRDLCVQWQGRQAEKNAQLCHQIAEMLHREYARASLTLPEIAERVGRSVGHIAKHYKRCYGKSVMQHLDEIRLEHARVLLAAPEPLTLDEVIERCGYVDKSNFIRKFKRAYQITPIRYRETQQKDPRDAL